MKLTLIIYIIWPSISKILSFKHVINTKSTSETFYILLSLWNSVCILHLKAHLSSEQRISRAP